MADSTMTQLMLQGQQLLVDAEQTTLLEEIKSWS
jgi:hypothetical protein